MKIIKFKNNKNVTELCIGILLLFISIDLTRANHRECGVVNCQGGKKTRLLLILFIRNPAMINDPKWICFPLLLSCRML
jgi:hypothetical protein